MDLRSALLDSAESSPSSLSFTSTPSKPASDAGSKHSLNDIRSGYGKAHRLIDFLKGYFFFGGSYRLLLCQFGSICLADESLGGEESRAEGRGDGQQLSPGQPRESFGRGSIRWRLIIRRLIRGKIRTRHAASRWLKDEWPAAFQGREIISQSS